MPLAAWEEQSSLSSVVHSFLEGAEVENGDEPNEDHQHDSNSCGIADAVVLEALAIDAEDERVR